MRPVRQAVTGSSGPATPSRIRRHARALRRGDARGRRAGRRLARHRDRARLLDGARPPRRPGRRRVRAGRVPRRPTGTLRALLSFVPWGRDGLSLDLMRRDRDADNGLIEFMVAALSSGARRSACERLSLNFAMFRAVFERGRADRRRAGPAAVAAAAAARLAVVAARVALPVERQVPAAWAPRFLCFREPAGPAPDRHRRRRSPRGSSPRRACGALQRRGVGTTADGRPGASPSWSAAAADAEPVAAALARRARRLPEQVRVRHAKLDRLRADGHRPVPGRLRPHRDLAQVRERASATCRRTPRPARRCRSPAGWCCSRDLGGLCFAVLQDGTRPAAGDARRPTGSARTRWRRGGATSTSATTSASPARSSPPAAASCPCSPPTWAMTAKCLRPLPDKHRGLTDPEARVRQRYLDLIVNRRRARRCCGSARDAVRAVREYLARPRLPRGRDADAAAGPRRRQRPAVHHPHQRLRHATCTCASRPSCTSSGSCVGGVEKVFELNRNFRNEGADATHNPEFTMLEAYEAYGDYDTMLELTQEMIQHAARAALGRHRRRRTTAREYDLGGEWPVDHRQRRDLRTRSARRSPPTRRSSELRRALRPGRRAARPGVGPRARSCWSCTSTWSRTDTLAPTFYTRLPDRRLAADPPAPRRPAAGRAVGPGRLRRRDRHRVLRAGRPGRAAPAAHRAVAARRRRRPGGDGARRGLPASPWSTRCRRPAASAWASTGWS